MAQRRSSTPVGGQGAGALSVGSTQQHHGPERGCEVRAGGHPGQRGAVRWGRGTPRVEGGCEVGVGTGGETDVTQAKHSRQHI